MMVVAMVPVAAIIRASAQVAHPGVAKVAIPLCRIRTSLRGLAKLPRGIRVAGAVWGKKTQSDAMGGRP